MTEPDDARNQRSVDGGSLEDQVEHLLPDFRLLFETECSFVWNTLRRLGIGANNVEDAAQDVFLVVHRHLRDYDPTRPLRPWLFGICYRVAIAHRRRAHVKNERVALSDSQPVDPIDSARPIDEQVEARQAQEMVRAALDTLDLDRRAMIVMHEYEGCSVPEIAEMLGVPVNTAYSRLRLAREQFVAAVRRLQASTPKEKLRAFTRGAAR